MQAEVYLGVTADKMERNSLFDSVLLFVLLVAIIFLYMVHYWKSYMAIVAATLGIRT